MEKFIIKNNTLVINKQIINTISFENKNNKYILYSFHENVNETNNDFSIFHKFAFKENFSITPKKKFIDTHFKIQYTNNIYTLLWNNNPVYFLQNITDNNNIPINHLYLKLILSDGTLLNNDRINLPIKNNEKKNIFTIDLNNIHQENVQQEIFQQEIVHQESIQENVHQESIQEEIVQENVHQENVHQENVHQENVQEIVQEIIQEIVQENVYEGNIHEESIHQENVQENVYEGNILKKNDIFSLENILFDFNRLFKSIDDSISDENIDIKKEKELDMNKNIIITNKKNKVEKGVEKELEKRVENKKRRDEYMVRIQYLNVFYKLSVIKLEPLNEIDLLNVNKIKINETNIINNSMVSYTFEIQSIDANYLISYLNQRYLLMKENGILYIMNIYTKKYQTIKNKEYFKLVNNDYMVYNDLTLIVPMIYKKIYNNHYGTLYSVFLPISF